jgi:streptogramin lyase
MTNKLITLNRPEASKSASGRHSLRCAYLAVSLVSGLFFQGTTALSQTSGAQLHPGDIIYADSGNSLDGGFVIKVDPATHEQIVIASGGNLQMPYGIVVDSNGQIVVSDSGRLIHIDPWTRTQTVIADSRSVKLGTPYGIDLDLSGQIVAANAQSVVRVDPASAQTTIISSGSKFRAPTAVAVAENSLLFVTDLGSPGQILRVNPQNGNQRVVTSGGYLNSPRSIAVQGNDLYVTDVVNTNLNYGVIGRVIHIDARTGAQRLITEGQNLVDPVGIAVDATGQLIVGDPSTVNPSSPDLVDGGYDGALIRIDPASGVQTLIARGQGGYINPRSVAIVPSSAVH